MKFLRPLFFAASVAFIAAFTLAPVSVVVDTVGAVATRMTAIEPVALAVTSAEPAALLALFILAAVLTVVALVLHVITNREDQFREWLATGRMPLAPDRSPPG